MRTLLLVSAVLIFTPLPAQQTPSSSVLDWYLDVPNKYLGMNRDSNLKPLTREERRRVIKTQDIANGYIQAADDDLNSEYEVALFKRRRGAPMLAIAEDGVSVQHVVFVERTASGWKDITK